MSPTSSLAVMEPAAALVTDVDVGVFFKSFNNFNNDFIHKSDFLVSPILVIFVIADCIDVCNGDNIEVDDEVEDSDEDEDVMIGE